MADAMGARRPATRLDADMGVAVEASSFRRPPPSCSPRRTASVVPKAGLSPGDLESRADTSWPTRRTRVCPIGLDFVATEGLTPSAAGATGDGWFSVGGRRGAMDHAHDVPVSRSGQGGWGGKGEEAARSHGQSEGGGEGGVKLRYSMDTARGARAAAAAAAGGGRRRRRWRRLLRAAAAVVAW